MATANKVPSAPFALSVQERLKASGLKLTASDIKALETAVPEFEISAAMIRKERSYLEEPVQTLRLWAK
jgi:hypothetical protein